MSRPLRWLGYTAGAVAAILLVAAAAVWLLSERILHKRRDVPVARIPVSADSATLARGNHLIAILGCSGCHGKALQGKVLFDGPNIARLTAPNLTTAITRYSDDSLALVIRDGVNAEGRGVLAMPSSVFYNLSDADIGALIAALRSRPRAASDSLLPPNAYRALGRLGLVVGQFQSEADRIDRGIPRIGERGDTSSRGRGEYLAKTTCIECHGTDLRGDTLAPSLAGAYGYTLDDLIRLARTAAPREPKTLGMMAAVARDRLSHMRDSELADLHAYLQSLPADAPATAVR